MLDQGEGSGALMGTGVLETHAYDPDFYPLEQVQDRVWHPIYFQSTGECIQILIFMSTDQIIQQDIAFSDFELDGLILFTNRSSDRLQ